jgi:hypothetical protein
MVATSCSTHLNASLRSQAPCRLFSASANVLVLKMQQPLNYLLVIGSFVSRVLYGPCRDVGASQAAVKKVNTSRIVSIECCIPCISATMHYHCTSCLTYGTSVFVGQCRACSNRLRITWANIMRLKRMISEYMWFLELGHADLAQRESSYACPDLSEFGY